MSLLPSAATLSHHLEKLTSATDASLMDKSHITSFILAFQTMEEPGAVLGALRHRLVATWASQAMVAQLRTLTVTARWLDFLSAVTNEAPNEAVWQSICGEVARHESEPAFRVLVGEIQARMATLAATWWGDAVGGDAVGADGGTGAADVAVGGGVGGVGCGVDEGKRESLLTERGELLTELAPGLRPLTGMAPELPGALTLGIGMGIGPPNTPAGAPSSQLSSSSSSSLPSFSLPLTMPSTRRRGATFSPCSSPSAVGMTPPGASTPMVKRGLQRCASAMPPPLPLRGNIR
jgi:hypothetical protein